MAVCMLCMLSAQAQTTLPHNWRSRSIIADSGRILLDTLSIDAATFQIEGLAGDEYVLDAGAAVLMLKKPDGDSLHVRYRVLPVLLTQPRFHKDRGLIDSQIALHYLRGAGSEGNDRLVDFNAIEYTGSYGRSMSMGNGQDAALSSQFNLQAAGYLPDSILLEAAISDNTLPFQPEGTTQRLQEFDQVYIRMSRGRHALQLGDLTIERPGGYFLNVRKRVQGLYFGSGSRIGRRGDNSFGISGSVARGEFARNIFNGLEGNQGPYRLTGNNAEQFFIVLAGSERVFINGQLQERGESADYTINYNTGEVRFMPRRLITRDSRIQVEFEYQSRNYLNSLIYAWDELQAGDKWRFRLNVYANGDAKNQGYLQSLSGEQKRFLSAIGDSVQQAWFPVIGTDTFSAGRILYRMTDTTVGGIGYDSVFIHSIDPALARYALSFSYLGPGKGDYRLSDKASNGRVYDWVPRVGGIPQGDHAPVQLLISPKAHQVLTLQTSCQLDSLNAISIELGASRYDPNLFASGGGASHTGIAAKLKYSGERFFGKRNAAGGADWQWRNEAGYEFVQDRFRAPAPFRSVEFGRDWNVPILETAKPDEHVAGYASSLQHRKLGAAAYSIGYYGRGNGYAGLRHAGSYSIEKRSWRIAASMNLLHARDTLQRSRFFRPGALAEYRLKHTIAGLNVQQEDNRILESYGESMRPEAYRFTTATAYIRSTDAQPLRYGISYTRRDDELPRDNRFLRQSHSHTAEASLTLARSGNHFLGLTGSWRSRLIDDTGFNNQRPQESGLGRLEYTGSFFGGAVRLQTLYETGAGQEPRRSYVYVEVPAGQGVYTWVDYNGNGAQEANEFELAMFPDQKRFIRLYSPGSDYVRVNYVTLNQSVSLDPSALPGFSAGRGWRKLLSRFSDEGSLQISNRLTNTDAAQSINPFLPVLRDDRIIIASSSISNTAFFNRAGIVWGLDYTWQLQTVKQLLNYGVEGLAHQQHTGRLRWNINASFSSNLYVRTGLKSSESALSDGRSYAVRSYSGEPALTWMYRGILRITGGLRYEDRTNSAVYGGERASIRRADLECRYSRPLSGVLVLRGGYAGISYKGLVTAPVAFTMLDALLPGANFLWHAGWDRRLSKAIELSLEYDGRKPGSGGLVHTGRMSVRAML